MFKKSVAAAAVLAAIACVVASPASAHNWWWSTKTARVALENADAAWRTPPSWVHVNEATCRGFGAWRIGDARRLFQHFRCSVEGQEFNDARARAAKKAKNDAEAAYNAAVAAGADEATLDGLYNAFLAAQDRWIMLASSGTHRRFRLVLNVRGQFRYSVSKIVRGPALATPISSIPSGAFDEPPIEFH